VRVNRERKEGAWMATDPVCYGEVEERGAKHRASFKGQEYFFCTASCRKKFEENPERYARLATTFHIDPQMSC